MDRRDGERREDLNVKWTQWIAIATVLLVTGLPAYADLGYGRRGGPDMGRDYRHGAPPFFYVYYHQQMRGTHPPQEHSPL